MVSIITCPFCLPLPQKPRRTSGNYRTRGDVFGYHRSGPYEGTLTNRYSRQDHCATTNGCSLADARRNNFPISLGLRSTITRSMWVFIVDEHHAVTDEHF